MLMTCPRCGFEQPKDQFCANCGLKIANYQAKQIPWIARALQHPAFYLGLVVAILVAFYALVRSNRPPILVATAPSASQTTVKPEPERLSEPTAKEASTVESALTDAVADPSATPDPILSAGESFPEPDSRASEEEDLRVEKLNAESLAKTQSEAIANLKEPAAPPPTQLNLQFVEISRSALQALGGDTKLDSPNLLAVRLSSKEKVRTLLSGGRKIGPPRAIGTRPSTAADWDTPLQGNGGLFLDLSVVRAGDGEFEVETAGQFISPGRDPSSNEGRFVGQVGVPFNGGVILSRMVPHTQLPEGSAEPSGVLSVLLSPDFLRQETELVLVIEAKSP